MSAARDLLADLDMIGAKLEPAGDRLILRAGSKAIPADLVRRIRDAKADLLATFAAGQTGLGSDNNRDCGGNTNGGRYRTPEARIVDWLNRHPTPSPPGRCAWCGTPESPSTVVLPFGTGPHTWLHSECWSDWQIVRRADAVAALRAIDPTFTDPPSYDHGD
jgi:hypothetical protein